MFLHYVSPKYIFEWFVVTVTHVHRMWEMLQGLRWEPWRFADRAGIHSTFLDFNEIMLLPTTMLQECLQTFGYFSLWYLVWMAQLKLSINFLQLSPQVVDLLVRGGHINNKLPVLQFKLLRSAGNGDIGWRKGIKNCFLYSWILPCQLSCPRICNSQPTTQADQAADVEQAQPTWDLSWGLTLHVQQDS